MIRLLKATENIKHKCILLTIYSAGLRLSELIKLRKAVEKSGVNPLATVHTLRHSFATHLICKGVSLRDIQELLGHESSKTTEVYTHLTGDQLREVKSPLEGLDI